MRYDYDCSACPATVERSRSVAERDSPVTCHCGAPMKRAVSRGGSFILKGSGWEKDRYK